MTTERRENFPVASLLLRPSLRAPVRAFYAWARAADDVADGAAPASEKRRQLDAAEKAAAALGAPGAGCARELLVAFRRDADGFLAEDWDDLLDYCRWSAAPVGRFLLRLHGEDEAVAGLPADALCAALQILNHLQDLRDDWISRGRRYLPRRLLDDAGALETDLAASTCSSALRVALNRALDRTQALLSEAARLPGAIRDRRFRAEAAAILALAAALLAALRRGDPLAGRVALSRPRMALLGLAAAIPALVRRPRRRRGSFEAALLILPAERRAAMRDLYRFCRRVDDIADGPWPRAEKLRALSAERGRIPPELTAAAARFPLDPADLDALVDGMMMDATQELRGPSWDVLDLYCDRVASAVGRLSAAIFGASAEEGAAVAAPLGRALQLTNILRDLEEDARRGRLYLAAEWLATAGISARDPAAVLADPALPLARRALIDQARAFYAQADAALAMASGAMRPARAMRRVYGLLLERLARSR